MCVSMCVCACVPRAAVNNVSSVAIERKKKYLGY